MNTAALLSEAGRIHPEEAAIAVGTAVHSRYREFARRAGAIAGHLRGRLGLAPGDHVALIMRNCPQYLELLYGIWHAGMVAVPVNAKLHRREFEHVLSDSQSRACFVTADLADTILAAGESVETLGDVIVVDHGRDHARLIDGDYAELVPVEPTSPAWLFYTSGTTGRPKGAVLTHRNLMIMTWCYYADVDWVEPGHAILHTGPLSHGSGLYGLPHIAKASTSVFPDGAAFDVAETASLIGAHRNVTMFAAPTMLTRLIHSPAFCAADLTNLRTLFYGGGPTLAADLERAIGLFGPALYQVYGQGESPMTITGLDRRMHMDRSHPRYGERLLSAGVARTGVEVRVVDGDDRTVAAGEIGEVCVRGEIVMAGYWRNPEATAETLRGGWLHTGDLGSMDDDGFLTLRDRAKDMIISGGMNIYSREVEDALLRHPDVYEVAVVGRPSAEWGEDVVAFVVPHAGRSVTADALDAVCLDSIARFKRPKDYRFLAELPKNNYGKIVKTELRKLLAGD